MPTFATFNREVVRKLRTAYLSSRAITGDVCGQNFTRAKVHSVKRDPLSPTGRWRIRIGREEPGAADRLLVER